jgi:hypothetical protein
MIRGVAVVASVVGISLTKGFRAAVFMVRLFMRVCAFGTIIPNGISICTLRIAAVRTGVFLSRAHGVGECEDRDLEMTSFRSVSLVTVMLGVREPEVGVAAVSILEGDGIAVPGIGASMRRGLTNVSEIGVSILREGGIFASDI